MMQEEQMVCYDSSNLNEHDHNYVPQDFELEIIVHALKMWSYSWKKKEVLMSDHGGMRYLVDQPKMNVRQEIWLSLISEFDFEIKYIKHMENKVVDVLSRRLQVAHIVVIGSCEINIQKKYREVV